MRSRTNGSRLAAWALYLVVALLALWIAFVITGHNLTVEVPHTVPTLIHGH